jgi:uncharacterized membrane protein (UPF0182 family)
MVAWMTARCDGEQYGKLLVYTFPKQKLIFGPMQIEARIDQDNFISQWITLRDQKGSTVIRGDLLVIPIKESILYVEPIYLEGTRTQLPELKQVIVAFGKRLTMKDNLRDALFEVFDVEAPKVEGDSYVSRRPKRLEAQEGKGDGAAATGIERSRALASEAKVTFDAAQQKVAQGDWTGYGQEQQRLRQLLEELAAILEGKLTPGASASPPSAAPPTVPPAPAPTSPTPPAKK